MIFDSIEPENIYFEKSQYIETESGNKISRKAIISGSQNIVLGGNSIIRENAVLRGDLRRAGSGHAVSIALGRYCHIQPHAIIRPPSKTYKGQFSYYPVRIGDFVTIGSDSVIEAASVGSHTIIGSNCIIGEFVIIKECCVIQDGAIIPPNTVLPPFSHYIGSSCRNMKELPECAQDIIEDRSKQFYHHCFKRQQ